MASETRLLELESATSRRIADRMWMPLALFCLGHFFIDLYSSALGVFQPLLIPHFRMNFTQAGIVAGVLLFSSSVMQPVYGYLCDRLHTRLFTTLAPAMAGIFISSLGWAPGYWGLLAMVWLGGAGIASFHPQATANATVSIKRNRGRAMAIFISAGTLGLALGPTYFSIFASRFGLARTPLAAIPGIIVTLLLLAFLPPGAQSSRAGVKSNWSALRVVWKPLSILYTLVVIRSVVQVTFTQFLPLYLHLQRGYSLSTSSYLLSLYLVAGAIGGFAGGHIADRWGGRFVILISMIGSVPFLTLFLLAQGALSIIGLALGGLILLFTIPVNVLMGQELVPAQAGTVSALMMGFGWGMAGLIFIPITGWLADTFSMQHAFAALTVFPLIGFFLALKLPKSQRNEFRT